MKKRSFGSLLVVVVMFALIVTVGEARGADTPAIESLIAALRDEDLGVRRWAVEALVKIGEPAVEPLIVALRYGHWHGVEYQNVRDGAAEALGKIGDPRAVGPLVVALRSHGDLWREDQPSLESAVEALVKIGEPAVEPLIAAMSDESHTVRTSAAWALGRIRGPRAEIVKRPGFRNIYLGMTVEEVVNALVESGFSKWATRSGGFVSIGPYSVSVYFDYDHHGTLYRIRLHPPPVTTDEIGTKLKEQVELFYGVFRKKFGDPTYIRVRSLLCGGEKRGGIDILDFFGEVIPLYVWIKDNVRRCISPRTPYLMCYVTHRNYGITISITDIELEEIKKRKEIEKAVEDF